MFPLHALLCVTLAFGFVAQTLPIYPFSALAAQANQSLSLAVLPFENLTRQPADDWMGLSLAESLTGALAKIPHLQVIERSQIKRLIQEQNFGQTALVDSSQAPSLGKMMGAKRMVVGHFQKVGDRLRIQARVIQVETGQVLPEGVVQVEGSEQAFFQLLDQLTQELSQQFQNGTASPLLNASHIPSLHEAHSLYYRGLYLLESGNSAVRKEVESLFQKALALAPKDALIQAGLARLYLSLGRTGGGELELQKSLHWAQSALTLNPKLSQAWLVQMEVHQFQKNFSESEATLKQALAHLPGNTALLLAYVDLLEQQRDTYFLPVNELKPLLLRFGANLKDPEIQVRLAIQLLQELQEQERPGKILDYSEPLALLVSARQSQPDNPLIPLYLGQIYLANEQPEKADTEIEQALKLDPKGQWVHQLAHSNLMRLYYFYKSRKNSDREREYLEKALKVALKLVELNPRNTFSLIQVAQDYEKLNDRSAALTYLTQAEQQDPSHPNIYTARLTIHKKDKNWQAVLATIELAFERCKSYPYFSQQIPYLKYEKAEVLEQLGQNEAAMVLWLELQLTDGFRGIALQKLIEHSEKQKDYVRVHEYYLNLFQVEPDLAQESYYQKGYQKNWLLQELQKNPTSAAHLNELAQIYAWELDDERALALFQQALSLAPENAVILYNFGSYYLNQQAYASALPLLKQALQFQAKYSNAMYNLGLAHLGLNQIQEAKACFQQVLDWEPTHQGAQVALAKLKP